MQTSDTVKLLLLPPHRVLSALRVGVAAPDLWTLHERTADTDGEGTDYGAFPVLQ